MFQTYGLLAIIIESLRIPKCALFVQEAPESLELIYDSKTP